MWAATKIRGASAASGVFIIPTGHLCLDFVHMRVSVGANNPVPVHDLR